MSGYRGAQAVPQFAGKYPVLNHHIGLTRQQQAQRVEVGRTDRGPMPVDHRHLGMQKAGFVLVNFNPRLQQRAIDGARGVVLHEIFIPPLQQQGHLDAAPGRLDQRPPELATRHEVGIGNQYVVMRLADGLAVHLLDAAAVAQIVTQHQGSLAAGHASRPLLRRRSFGCQAGCFGAATVAGSLEFFPGGGQVVLPRAVASLYTPPQQRHGLGRFRGHWPGHGHRKIKTRGCQLAVVGVVEVVQHIDAAAKNRVLVHHTQLAVQAAPSIGYQQAEPAQASGQRRIDQPHHSGVFHLLLPGRRQGVRANAVDQHLDAHPAQRGPHQRLSHLPACQVQVKNVGFHLHPGRRAVYRADQGGKILLPALEQLQSFRSVQVVHAQRFRA